MVIPQKYQVFSVICSQHKVNFLVRPFRVVRHKAEASCCVLIHSHSKLSLKVYARFIMIKEKAR